MTAVTAPMDPGCYIKPLPERLQATAFKVARDIYPGNNPFSTQPPANIAGVLPPQRIAVLMTKYWGPKPRALKVRFLEPQLAPAALQQRILSHMNAWKCSITFALAGPGEKGDVRVSLVGDGYWSYLGTDVLLIPDGMPTMNLQGFSMSTPESEYKRVVRHETGHTLGFPHEHLRQEVVNGIDRDAAYDYFGRTQGWSPDMVDNNVLTPIETSSLMGTPVDTLSIMCYQLPGQIMKNGQPVLGGNDIDATDAAFCHQIYPTTSGATAPRATPVDNNDWGEAEDVKDLAAKIKRLS